MSREDKMIKPLGKKLSPMRTLRAKFFAAPFALLNEATSWEFTGQDKLIACIAEHQRTGRGLITVSNHVSLFDDPLVLLALLNIRRPNEDNKIWYSTACADNFNPKGTSVGARITRFFSEISNIVFLSRSHKRTGDETISIDPVQAVIDRFDERLEMMVERRAASLGLDVDRYIQTFLTPWGQGMSPSRVQTFNQAGLVESCVRVDAGDWVHFFPEGGRSRDMHLRKSRPGVGKVLYQSSGARVVPLCFYGTQDIMPVGAKLPLPGKTVHVAVGDPIDESDLQTLRRRPESTDTYQALSSLAMDHISQLRPDVLSRYLGPEKAARLLLEETQMARAMEPSPASSTAVKNPPHMDLTKGSRPIAEHHPRRRAN